MVCQSCVNQGMNRKDNQMNNGQMVKGSHVFLNCSQCPQCTNIGNLNGTNLLNNYILTQNDTLNSKENNQLGCLCSQRIHNSSFEARRIATLSSNNRIENIRNSNVYCCCCHCNFGLASSYVNGINYTCNNTCSLQSCCICSNNTISGVSNCGAFSTNGSNGTTSFVINDNNGNIKQVNDVNQCLSNNNIPISGSNTNNNSEICSPNAISGTHVVTHNGNQHEANYKTTVNPDMINIALTGQTPESLTISIDSRGIVTLGVNNSSNTNSKTTGGCNPSVNNDDSRTRIRNALTDRS
ncbi:hypothetical protein FG379_001879 [Cryptosporidium bovis]|uniref:uncharacterized protein n=1 Tax=Cryptosporidium bovis TaxID=310047 RepID=UPI003519DAB5|nr:hypothetical protein FG379_001879 [Cryptosporidium bovis]